MSVLHKFVYIRHMHTLLQSQSIKHWTLLQVSVNQSHADSRICKSNIIISDVFEKNHRRLHWSMVHIHVYLGIGSGSPLHHQGIQGWMGGQTEPVTQGIVWMVLLPSRERALHQILWCTGRHGSVLGKVGDCRTDLDRIHGLSYHLSCWTTVIHIP